MVLLEVHHVELAYATSEERIMALENLNLQVNAGEFVTIVGPSGCGKSSLLALAAGTQFPTCGVMQFQGERINGTDPKRGMMFQNPTLFPWLNVLENVAFGLKMQGVSKRQRSHLANEYLKQMGLQEFAEQRVYELSGGMKQRVAIARTLLNDPELVLLDEPFGALDAFTKRKMQQLLQTMWKQTGKTFLFVTHDVEEAVRLGTRVIVMSPRPGTILADLSVSPDQSTETQMIEQIHELLVQSMS